MDSWIYDSLPVILKLVASAIIIFGAIIMITRISGLRTFAKMSSFDFASTIAIGSILASVIMSTGQSLLKGAVAMATIIVLQTLFSLMVRKSEWFKRWFTNKPILLMKGDKILYENLAKTNVSEGNLLAKLREANVVDFEEVLAVVLESTGDVSVLHKDGNKELDQKLLEGVTE